MKNLKLYFKKNIVLLYTILLFIPVFGQNKEFNQDQLLWEIKLNEHLKNIEEAKNSNNDNQLIEGYITIGTFYNNRNSIYSDYNKAIVFFEEALKISNTKHVLNRARCYEGIGNSGRFLQNVIIASENYSKAERLYFELNDNNKRATCLHRIGDLLLDQKNYELSKSYYERAITLYSKENNSSMVSSCTSNIGEVYVFQGKYQKGLTNFNKALKMNKEKGYSPRREAFILFEVGKLYIDSIHYTKRDSIFNKALKIVEKEHLLDGIAYANTLLAKLYYKDQKYTLAKEHAKKGLAIALSYGHKIKIRMAYLISAKIDEKLKLYSSALKHHKSYKEIDSEVQQKERNIYSAEMETKYNISQKNNTILRIENEKEQAQEQRNATIFFLIVLTILVIALIVYQIKLNKSNKKLIQQKDAIQKVNYRLEKTVNYKEVLLKEVHHRVKNNLQIICSILEMQIDASGSLKLKEKLQTSIDRIFSMALVHEQLYTDDSNETIDACSYFNDIVDSIMSSQQNTKKNISIDINMDDIQLKLGTALPLGMILNELITNAFKYAFSSKKEGTIAISLQSIGQHISLLISDNGTGIDIEKSRKNSIGLQLAKDFTTQIKGTLTCHVDKGTHYKITFPI